jgi:hypothetical protein
MPDGVGTATAAIRGGSVIDLAEWDGDSADLLRQPARPRLTRARGWQRGPRSGSCRQLPNVRQQLGGESTANLVEPVAARLDPPQRRPRGSRRSSRAFVALPSPAASSALALWVVHTWAFAGAHATPYLVVVSPERRTGKTRLLEVLELIVRRPWRAASASEAALFRRIALDAPALMLDEIDAIFGSASERTEPLRAVLNAGNRPGASVARCVGQAEKRVEDFSVYCPKVLAGIDSGRLPDTITDRAVVIHMKRRHAGESVERLRSHKAEADAAPLRDDLAAWAAHHSPRLAEAEPELPDPLNDRAADSWEPLFAIADEAGGEWPDLTRAAAVELTNADDDEATRGAQVLRAMRNAMNGHDVIATAELLEAINADDELPFGGWRDGRGLDARGLARLVRPYGVRPRSIRVEDATPKGYRRDDLREVWERYLPTPPEAQHAPQPPQPPSQSPPEIPASNGHVADVADVAAPAGSNGSDYAQRYRERVKAGAWGLGSGAEA